MLGSLLGGGPLGMSQFNVTLFSSRNSSYSLNRGPHIVTVQQAPQMTYPVQQASPTSSAAIARFRLRVHNLSSLSRLTRMPHCSLASTLVPYGLFPTTEPQGPFKLGVRIMSPLAQRCLILIPLRVKGMVALEAFHSLHLSPPPLTLWPGSLPCSL